MNEDIKHSVSEIKDRAHSIIDKTLGELEEIEDIIKQYHRDIAHYEYEQDEAIKKSDTKKYQKAESEIEKLKIDLNMYRKRRDLLKNEKGISETESDQVIDLLLELQNKNANNMVESVKPLLSQILEIVKEYYSDMLDIENTIIFWTSNVHANYNSRGAVVKNGSTRLDYIYPVRATPYQGCKEFQVLDKTLKELALTSCGVGLVRENN